MWNEGKDAVEHDKFSKRQTYSKSTNHLNKF